MTSFITPFYAFHKTIAAAAECLNRELRSATADAKIISMLWPKYKDLYESILKHANRSRAKKIDPSIFPYCVVGTDTYPSHECSTLFCYLNRHRDYDLMNHLVNLYDELQSRRVALNAFAGSDHILDNETRIEYIEARLKKAVRMFLSENNYTNIDPDLYDYSVDIKNMRNVLHYVEKRDVTI
jgi:hypothetical protein